MKLLYGITFICIKKCIYYTQRLKNQLELIENSTSSVKVVIDWLTSDKSLNNQISKLKLNTFADKLGYIIIMN